MNYKEKNNLFFKILAPSYDILASPINKIRKKIIKFSKVKKSDKVLDICTGTGSNALTIAPYCKEIIGIDISKDMLKLAKKKNTYPNAKFQIADASKLPFKDNSFDLTMVSMGLHEMPKKIRKKTVSEMKRVTKKNKLIVIIDYSSKKGIYYFLISLFEGKNYIEFVSNFWKNIRSEKEIILFNGLIKVIKFKK